MAQNPKQLARYFTVQIIGILCVVIGIAGLVLPILNGIFPLAIGLMLIAMYNPSLHRYIHRLVARFPWLEDVFEKAEEFFEKLFGEPPEGIPPIRHGFPNYQRKQQEAAEKATKEGSETTDL